MTRSAPVGRPCSKCFYGPQRDLPSTFGIAVQHLHPAQRISFSNSALISMLVQRHVVGSFQPIEVTRNQDSPDGEKERSYQKTRDARTVAAGCQSRVATNLSTSHIDIPSWV